jgi:hypothetical protein
MVEATPVTAERQVRYDPMDLLTLLILRPAWAYRAELTIASVLTAAWVLARVRLGLNPVRAGLLALVPALMVVVLPWTRNHLVGLLHRAQVRRTWDRACRHAELATHNDRVPIATKVRSVPAGDAMRVKVPAGSQVPDLEDAAEPIAAHLEAMQVRVKRDPANARYADVTIVRRDPLAEQLIDPWPWLRAGRLDLWHAGIPVGVDESGDLVCLDLTEKNVLVGGEPGSGKSVAASMLLAAAALDPRVRLVLCDGALVELAPWKRCAESFVGPDPDAFLAELQRLGAELDRRLHALLDRGQRKVTPGDGLPLIVVVIDELAFYLNTGNRKRDEAIAAALRDLIARGRKAGIIVIAATQRPSYDVVPTSIRDLFAYRWAFRCTTPEASDTILGRGHASAGYSADTIDATHRGVGWLRAEGTEPRRLRTYYLTDAHIEELAEHAATARQLARTHGRSRLHAELRRIDTASGDHVQDGEHTAPAPDAPTRRTRPTQGEEVA